MSDQSDKRETKEFISRFKILSKLGEGGMGKVYKAHDPALNKEFALKVLNVSDFSEKHHIRFQQEAKTLKDLKHDAIPEIYNFAISRDGDPYLVMEYIDGKSLSKLLQEKVEFEESQIKDIIVQVCEALGYAHENGIIHRDIKPDNIILTGDDLNKPEVKLIDFGIAKLEDSLTKDQDMTQTGVIIGSPPYINPEQIRGQSATVQSDIYSLGCVMFELLAKHPPFIGKNALNTLSMHLEVPVQDVIAKIPERFGDSGLVSIIEKCIQKDSAARFQSAKEIQTAIEKLDTESTGMSPLIEVEEFKSSSMKPVIVSGIIGLSLLFAVVFFGPDLLKVAYNIFYGEDYSATKKGPEDSGTFFKHHASGAKNPRQWEFVPMGRGSSGGYYRGGEEIEDIDFKNLLKEELKPGTQIRSEFSDKVTGDGIKYLAGKPIELLVIASESSNDKLLENVKNLPNLKVLSIGISKHFSINGYNHLANTNTLIRLSIKNQALPDETINTLSNLKHLQMLRLDGSTNLTEKQLSKLAKFPKLNELHLDGTDVKGSSLKTLSQCKTLKVLSLRGLKLKDSDVAILNNLPLKKIDLTGNAITVKSIFSLAKNKHLSEIVIGGFKPKSISLLKVQKEFELQRVNKNCKLKLEPVMPNPQAT